MSPVQDTSQAPSLQQILQNASTAEEHRKALSATLMRIAFDAGFRPIDFYYPQQPGDAVADLPKEDRQASTLG